MRPLARVGVRGDGRPGLDLTGRADAEGSPWLLPAGPVRDTRRKRANMNEPGIYAHLMDDDARDVLVLDSSTFIKEIGLTSQKGSSLKHYLYRRGTQLAVPEAAAEEYQRNLIAKATGRIERIQQELAWLAQFCGGVDGWRAPGSDLIEARAEALAAGGELGAVLLPEPRDTRERARLRDRAERPPSHRTSELGDCRIWEQCLDLLSSHDVVLVSDDRDFRSHRKPDELHPLLRAEAQEVGRGRSLTFHPGMESLLADLKSEIPPIPNDVIFEFLYREIDDRVQLLESNSGCRATSTGEIKQARFTTDAPELIEVRLEVADTWVHADGTENLPFHLTGTCRYHLRDERLADLKTGVVRLSRREADGSVRSVTGSRVSASGEHGTFGAPPIRPKPGRLE